MDLAEAKPKRARSPRKSKEAGPQASASIPDRTGRVVIEDVTPCIEGGLFPIKRVLGEEVTVEADIFSDGHEILGADLLFRPASEAEWRRVPMELVENDRWRGRFGVDALGAWRYCVEAWRDSFASWAADTRKKQLAGQDLSVEISQGLDLAGNAAADGGSPGDPLAHLLSSGMLARMRRSGPREDVGRSAPELTVHVDRKRALFSAWYELFPRSLGSGTRHGSFDDVIAHLPYVRDLGFDVLYFPPIHPIGQTNRKGRNNSLRAEEGDPGSVYAIGSEEGGHEAIHPELGSFDDFRRLVESARAQGMEIALDFAVQCSPDHPWIRQHPDWFAWRPDGTIKYAENPPKKYEDIVNIKFDGPAFPEAWFALRAIVSGWVAAGVRIFRVDNPHTKPLPFWRWLIAEINRENPDVIFLAEAFTRPKMMKRLAKEGFQQSYTYFTWRNTKYEITTYMQELAGEMGEYYRPNFFVNTPDINPYFLQTSGRAGFVARATLAATLSSNWGIYSGFEFCEAAALPGREEYADSEKYELRHRNFDAPGNIKDHIRSLNQIRNENPGLQGFRNILFLNAWNESIIAYARFAPDQASCVFVMVNLDPHHAQEATYEVPLWEFGLPDWASLEAEDLILGFRFTLYGKTHRIRLDPGERPVVIWRLTAGRNVGGRP